MKKFSMIMLLAGATYALTGCLVTDYPCITDTENPDYAVCATNTGAALHDTAGWAHIIESGQTASDLNGDTIYSNFISFVSQDSTGNQMIAAVAEVQTIPSGNAAEFVYHSDQYVQGGQKDLGPVFAYAAQGENPADPDGKWPPADLPGIPNPGVVGPITGNCATPENNGGVVGSGNVGNGFPAFDYVLTTSCLVADPDLSMLASYFDRNPGGEAGRVAGNKISTADRVALLKHATPTAAGLEFTLGEGDLNVVVSQGTMSKTIDMSHLYGRSLTINLDTNGIVGNEWAKNNGITGNDLMATRAQLVGFNKAVPVTVTATIYGQTRSFTTKIAQGFDAQLLAATLDAAAGTGSNQTGSRRR